MAGGRSTPARARAVQVTPRHTRAGAHLISRDVEAVAYVHVDDGKAYRHDFEHAGVELWANQDGSLTIRHPRYRLWEDVVVVD